MSGVAASGVAVSGVAGGFIYPGDEAGRRYVVLGLGNRIQGDEALGSLVIEQLSADGSPVEALPDPGSIDLVDGGTVGLALLPRLEDADGLVVVDIIDGDLDPGALQDIDGSLLLRRDIVMGVHDLGATELLATLQLMGAMPRRVRVVGIQPRLVSLGTELTPEVEASVPALLDTVLAYLRTWQTEDGSGG